MGLTKEQVFKLYEAVGWNKIIETYISFKTGLPVKVTGIITGINDSSDFPLLVEYYETNEIECTEYNTVQLLLRKPDDMTGDERKEYDKIVSEPSLKQCAFKLTLWSLKNGFCLDDEWFEKGWAERITE